MRVNALSIHTPEGITFSLPLASPVTRFLAWLLDGCCVFALMLLIQSILRVVMVLSEDLAYALAVFLFFAIQIGYGILCEWHWRGQTVGKRLFRLRVMDESGLRLQFSQVVIRNLLRFVDGLPLFYLVGGAACLINRRSQRLGDMAANTVVVRNRKTLAPNLSALMAGKFNSFRAYPHLEARLRKVVSPDEAFLALQALLRRDGFAPQARVELFRQMAQHFAALVQFPVEALDGLADEQYVRNVVDSVFRTPSLDPIAAIPGSTETAKHASGPINNPA
jgi:uncharacterized RDD family membrane protein YckC